MHRWLMVGSLFGLLVCTTGCLHHHTSGGCSSSPSCNSSACHTAPCTACGGGRGLLGKLCGVCGGKSMSGGCGDAACGGSCGISGCRNGCVAGPLGWQQGGLDYSSHLNPGLLGHGAGARLQSRPFTPGPPTAQTAYPYYTHHGPRDFLMDNPPTIGR